MNERTPTSSSPETVPTIETPHFAGIPEGLQLASLDQIVALGEQARDEYAHDASLAGTMNDYVNAKVERALIDNGFDAMSDDTAMQENYVLAKDVYGVIARTESVDWVAAPKDDPDGLPMRNAVINMVRRRYDANEDEELDAKQDGAADAEAGEVQEVSLEDNRESLNDRRTKLAELGAKRQARIAGKGGEAYVEAKEAYDEQMVVVAKQELADMLADETISDEDKKVRVTEYLLNEQTLLRQETIKKLDNTPVGKFVKWFTKGGKLARAAKSVGLGLAAGAAGAAIGAVAGVAGVAAVGAGVATAATTAVRFARGFARKDAKEGRGMKDTLDKAQKTEVIASLDNDHEDSIDTVAARLSATYEADTKAEQKKRLKSVGAGALGIVLGAGAAAAVHAALDAGVFDGFGNRAITGTGNHVGAAPAPAEQPEGGHHAPDSSDLNKEAEKLAKEHGVTSSDTPGVADAINKALDGEGGGTTGGHGVEGYLAGTLGSTEMTPAGLANFETWANSYTVQPGDTIWGLSEKYLQAQGVAHPDVYQVDAVKDAVLADLQSRGLVGGNGWLTVGQKLR